MKAYRVACICLGLVAAPAAALACGGTFCSVPPPGQAPQPVDQSAERIIFHVGGDNTVTAHVQISYQGEPENFAWIVPVPSTPEVADSDIAVFQLLNQLTAPQIQLPAAEPCADGSSGFTGGGGSSFGCGAVESASGPSEEPEPQKKTGRSPVTVFAHDFTGSYEYHVIGAAKTSDIVAWLQGNSYNVSDNMLPLFDAYNKPEMRFLALRLQSNKTVNDIVPIKFKFNATNPKIPIKLTAVGAQPLMGIQVFIVGDTMFRPHNYTMVDPSISQIAFDANGNTNYFEWVAASAANGFGQRFVREFAGPNPLAGVPGGPLLTELASAPFVSRFYTRLSPSQMTHDPMFVPNTAADAAKGRLINLSSRPTLWRCFDVITERLPSVCAFNYCGANGACVESDAGASCDCDTGYVAQAVQNPAGGTTVTCVPKVNPFTITDQAGGVGSKFDPCNSYACGMGSCVLKGGFPTCECDGSAVAEILGGQVNCGLPSVTALRKAPTPPRTAKASTAPTPSGAYYMAAFLLLALVRTFRRVRRRR